MIKALQDGNGGVSFMNLMVSNVKKLLVGYANYKASFVVRYWNSGAHSLAYLLNLLMILLVRWKNLLISCYLSSSLMFVLLVNKIFYRFFIKKNKIRKSTCYNTLWEVVPRYISDKLSPSFIKFSQNLSLTDV